MFFRAYMFQCHLICCTIEFKASSESSIKIEGKGNVFPVNIHLSTSSYESPSSFWAPSKHLKIYLIKETVSKAFNKIILVSLQALRWQSIEFIVAEDLGFWGLSAFFSIRVSVDTAFWVKVCIRYCGFDLILKWCRGKSPREDLSDQAANTNDEYFTSLYLTLKRDIFERETKLFKPMYFLYAEQTLASLHHQQICLMFSFPMDTTFLFCCPFLHGIKQSREVEGKED